MLVPATPGVAAAVCATAATASKTKSSTAMQTRLAMCSLTIRVATALSEGARALAGWAKISFRERFVGS